MHQIPALAVVQDLFQHGAGDAVLHHPQLDREAAIAGQPGGQRLQHLAFLPQIERAGRGRQAEQCQDSQAFADRPGGHRRLFPGDLEHQADILQRQRPSAGMGQFQRVEQQPLSLRRHHHPHHHRGAPVQDGRGDRPEQVLPDPLADLADQPPLVGIAPVVGCGIIVKPAGQVDQGLTFRLGRRIERDGVIGQERAVRGLQHPAPVPRIGDLRHLQNQPVRRHRARLLLPPFGSRIGGFAHSSNPKRCGVRMIRLRGCGRGDGALPNFCAVTAQATPRPAGRGRGRPGG